MKFNIAICILCVSFCMPARQASADGLGALQLDIALDGKVGGESNALDWNGFLGYARPLYSLSGHWKLYAAAGVHAGWGTVNQKDRRAIDGWVNIGRSSLGGEARVGLAYGYERPKFYTYLGGGPTYYLADAISENLPESGGAGGYRASFGIAWPGSWRAIADRISKTSCDDGSCVLFLAFLMPNKIQMSYEQIDGADESTQRIGGGIGWSF